ncbi:hypothetical protein [Micromonospora maritima]|uniref:hypothetical protein n=1 Tax=Micromonospora maritima TaxID=986711 RepID=UPI00157D1437|nr:hypothetical protein [Micromonospora maritima]
MQTDTQTARAVAQPSLAELIRDMVPDHTAIVRKAPALDDSWTWSTPQGLWAIYHGSQTASDRGPYDVVLSGPGGHWTIRGVDQADAARQLRAVLDAFGALRATLPAAA